MRHARRAGAIAALALGCVSAAARAAGNVATEIEEQEVKVVGATPLPGILAPLDQIPSNVQIVTDRKLAAQPTPGPTDYLERGDDPVQRDCRARITAGGHVNSRGNVDRMMDSISVRA